MKKQIQEIKPTVTDGDSFYRLIPYAAAAAVAVLHVIAAIVRENIWLLFSGQLLAFLAFYIVRLAFPRPEDDQRAN
jgi:Na+/phosphate symporter